MLQYMCLNIEMIKETWQEKLARWDTELRLIWELHYGPKQVSINELSQMTWGIPKHTVSHNTINTRLRKAVKKWGIPKENENITKPGK